LTQTGRERSIKTCLTFFVILLQGLALAALERKGVVFEARRRLVESTIHNCKVDLAEDAWSTRVNAIDLVHYR